MKMLAGYWIYGLGDNVSQPCILVLSAQTEPEELSNSGLFAPILHQLCAGAQVMPIP